MMRHSVCALVLLMFMSLSVKADEIRIAAAANFYSTLVIIKKEFEKTHSDDITIIKGSTGKLYAQIVHGAPYDVFMAADSERPLLLEQKKLILKGSRYTYASGLLALWSYKNKERVLSTLKKGSFRKLAIANPKTAPYGYAAMEILLGLGLSETVKQKLVYGENIAQAFQFVQSGSADLGFVALSYVKQHHDLYWLVPEELYSPLEQQMVILKNSKKKKLATKFLNFIKQKNIKQMIQRQGYKI